MLTVYSPGYPFLGISISRLLTAYAEGAASYCIEILGVLPAEKQYCLLSVDRPVFRLQIETQAFLLQAKSVNMISSKHVQ